MSEVQPLKENLNAVLGLMLDALDQCAARALNDGTRAEIAAQEMRLGQIVSRAQLILSFLDAHKPLQRPTLTGRANNGGLK